MKTAFLGFGICLILFSGCGEKKVDPAKLAEANQLITNGQYEQGITVLDALAKDSPSDEALKRSRIDAHMKYANYLMYDSPLPPKQKYPEALQNYRAVVVLDPSNQEAKGNVDLIEGIYRSMGRPIPQ
jgi:tetratricopeptide (TPR) repeat protein